MSFCKDCPAWYPNVNLGTLQGECRFNPPMPAGFPVVKHDDWCLPGRGFMVQIEQSKNPEPPPTPPKKEYQAL